MFSDKNTVIKNEIPPLLDSSIRGRGNGNTATEESVFHFQTYCILVQNKNSGVHPRVSTLTQPNFQKKKKILPQIIQMTMSLMACNEVCCGREGSQFPQIRDFFFPAFFFCFCFCDCPNGGGKFFVSANLICFPSFFFCMTLPEK